MSDSDGSSISIKIDFFKARDGYWYWKAQRTIASGTYESNQLGPYTDSQLVQFAAFRILDCMISGVGKTTVRWTKMKVATVDK